MNLGKGEALKTGFNHALVHHPETLGVVTVDADGQHLPHDVRRVAAALEAEPEALCLGVRDFSGDVPWKSRVGNTSSRWMLRLVAGGDLRDTQTGLRGVPRAFMAELLPLKTARYEFELEMLIRAFEDGRPVQQTPIETVYHDQNAGSHFNPLWDSLRVYFVFLRFLMASLLTAGLDLIVFTAAFGLGQPLLASQIAGRLVAGTFNFLFNKHVVFKARQSYAVEAARYVGLVIALMLVSYVLIQEVVARFDAPVVLAKIGVEGFLFLVSFAAQRMFVFASGRVGVLESGVEPTDWDAYYEQPARLASFTRRLTARRLVGCLQRYRGDLRRAHLLELGGGNSCFHDTIAERLAPAVYEVVDRNPSGLRLFRERHEATPGVRIREGDVLDLAPPDDGGVDVCFSVGLIEHFDEAGTARAVRAHCEAVRPGGLVVLFFPTPTWPYRWIRGIAEAAGAWGFPDERPLGFDEVTRAVEPYGTVIHRSIHWWIGLTQGIVLLERGESPGAHVDG